MADIEETSAVAPKVDVQNEVAGYGNESPEAAQKRAIAEKRLWWWNLSCGILHLVQACVVLGIGQNKNSRAGKFRTPLTTQFLAYDQVRGFPVSQVVTRQQLPFVSLVSGFAWMSAAAHFLVLACYGTYIKDLRAGINKFRWFEYALSSSLMIALIALLFGMCFFGYDMELMNLGRLAKKARIDWAPFWFGSFAGALPWACVFTYLGGTGNVSSIPPFVWGIVTTYFLCFNSFPIGMIGQYARLGWFRDEYWNTFAGAGYYHGERSYQIQSLVSKSLLLWLVLGGANQPNEATANMTG